MSTEGAGDASDAVVLTDAEQRAVDKQAAAEAYRERQIADADAAIEVAKAKVARAQEQVAAAELAVQVAQQERDALGGN